MNNRNSLLCALVIAACAFCSLGASPDESAKRQFLHPGISHTQGDIDRMRAMIAAEREPWKGMFERLLRDRWSSLDIEAEDRGDALRDEKADFNNTIGRDGRRAHDLALIWKLTDDERYAKKAVEFLNANSHYKKVTWLGTAPLNSAKIILLIEAAELLRDYPGWAAEDQARFRNMLVAPECFIHWTRNFDAGRYGNQGLYAVRATMAAGIYLDDDKLYERALRYVKGEKHRADDEPYRSGPPLQGYQIQENDYFVEWRWENKFGDEEDYQYDDQILHYVKPNGQCQESSRDQHHTFFGLHNLVAIADIAWNQGDDIFSYGDNRILLGLEWTYRYNLSKIKSFPDQPEPWHPTGYTENEAEATFDNGMFLQYLHRSRRWKSLMPTDDTGDISAQGGEREAALAHYKIRAKLPPEKYKWLERYRDYAVEKYGGELWGVYPNWFYEWAGWGTLTKRRTDWMTGDPRKTINGVKVSGAHRPGEIVRWNDQDFSPIADQKKEERMRSYTFAIESEGDYKITIAYTSYSDSYIAASVDKSKPVQCFLPKASRKGSGRAVVKSIHFPAGACVLRLAIVKPSNGLKIAGFQVDKIK